MHHWLINADSKTRDTNETGMKHKVRFYRSVLRTVSRAVRRDKIELIRFGLIRFVSEFAFC